MNENIEIFFCYAREDEELRVILEKQLRLLKRQGVITTWHDRNISAGADWEHEINTHLNNAQIILLLISPDFMDSDYCYGVEMARAIDRHKNKEVRVIPVLLRPVYFREAPFGHLQVLPTDAIPVVSRKWHTLDEAFYDVAQGILHVIEEVKDEIIQKDKVLRAEIKLILDQGKEVSKEDFQNVGEQTIRNTMASLKQEFLSNSLIYDAEAVTLIYRNAEDIRLIHEACQRQMDHARAEIFVRRFLHALEMPERFIEIDVFQPSQAIESHSFLRKVLELALVEARREKKDYLGVPHLFIALLQMEGGCTQDAIRSFGFLPQQIENTMRLSLGSGEASNETIILPTRRCKKVLQMAELSAGSKIIDERAIVQAVLSEKDGVLHELLARLGLNVENLIRVIIASTAHTPLELSFLEMPLYDAYFTMGIVKTGEAVRGVPAEFPIFIPILNDQQISGKIISDMFQKLFQAAISITNSNFGLVLSPGSSSFLRNALTQSSTLGIKGNIAYLDENEMCTILASKDFEPQIAFFESVSKQVSILT